MAKRKEYKVIVEGQEFNSISSAARYLNTDVSCVRWALKYNKDRKYKGLAVRYADAAIEADVIKNLDMMKAARKERLMTRNKKKVAISSKCSPIYCETLKKTFKTLKSAAKFAGTSTYTLSTKTEVAGRYVDKAGNVYTRLKPMKRRTDKPYPNTGDKLHYDRTTGYTKAPMKENVSGIALAKSILKDKINAYVQSDNFKMAKELMDVVEQIKE